MFTSVDVLKVLPTLASHNNTFHFNFTYNKCRLHFTKKVCKILVTFYAAYHNIMTIF